MLFGSGGKMKQVISIHGGSLGPIAHLPPGGLEIRPLTVFIGNQGTGKSLLSQIIYFYRNLPFLVNYHDAVLGITDQGELPAPQEVIRSALDNLRSSRRAFAVFGNPAVTVGWSENDRQCYQFRLESRNRQITPHKELKDFVIKSRSEKNSLKPMGNAIYIPAERVIYSHIGGSASVWKMFSFPSTLATFADAIERATVTFGMWKDGIPDTDQGKYIHQLGIEALRGEVYRWGETWKWKYKKDQQFDIDMASSGQKANWPVVLLSQALFDWRKEGLINEPFYIHIEEPEIHLHPHAQAALINILTYLVNQGFQVLITTHSLTVLYALNNLLSASTILPGDLKDDRVPPPELRIDPKAVAAYWFKEDGEVQSIVSDHDLSIESETTRRASWIDEDTIREVDEELGQQLNRIRSYGVFWGPEKK
jgi:hypothetical protein